MRCLAMRILLISVAKVALIPRGISDWPSDKKSAAKPVLASGSQKALQPLPAPLLAEGNAALHPSARRKHSEIAGSW